MFLALPTPGVFNSVDSMEVYSTGYLRLLVPGKYPMRQEYYSLANRSSFEQEMNAGFDHHIASCPTGRTHLSSVNRSEVKPNYQHIFCFLAYDISSCCILLFFFFLIVHFTYAYLTFQRGALLTNAISR